MDKHVEKNYRQAFTKALKKGITPKEIGDIGLYYVHMHNDIRVDTIYLLWVEALHDILDLDSEKIVEIMDLVDANISDCVDAESYKEVTKQVAQRVFDKTGIMMSKYIDEEGHSEEVESYENVKVQSPFA